MIGPGASPLVPSGPAPASGFRRRNGGAYERAMVTHSIPLRLDLIAQIVVPVQMTQADVDRLCGVIRSLAFEEQPAGAERPAEGGTSNALNSSDTSEVS